MKRIKKIVSKNKSLLENFSYLSLLQVFSLVLPLLSYPYLIRVLGVNIYGKIVFAQAIISYFTIFVSFGFNISATKEVSIYRDDKSKLSEIVSSVLIIKTLMFFACLLIFIPLLFLFKEAVENKILYLTSLWMCIYEILFPSFYFQGIEKMKYSSIISVVVRSIFVVLIFVFIRSDSDYLFVPILNLVGVILAGATSIYIIFYRHKLKFYLPNNRILLYYFKDSIPVFLSNISIQIYVSTNKVLIGLFLGMTEISYYDLGEKILNILKIPQGILSQTVFPKVSRDKDIDFIKKIFIYSLLLNSLLFVLLFVFSDFIIVILGGQQMLPSKWVVRILGLTLPIVAISNIFGILILIPFGFNKLFSRIIMFSGIIFILQFFLLWVADQITIYSLCMITVITEIFVTFLMYYYCKKNNLWIRKSMII